MNMTYLLYKRNMESILKMSLNDGTNVTYTPNVPDED